MKAKRFLAGFLAVGVVFSAGVPCEAAWVRDGVHTAIFEDLTTMDRSELEDLRSQREANDFNAEANDFNALQGAGCVGVEYSQSDLDLLAALIMAEAGDQDFVGKRLVGDCVINRVNSPDPYWPDTVSEVIFQPYQFSPVLDGGLDRAWSTVTEDCYEAARFALSGDHIDTAVMYFSMWGCANGVFAFQHGDHYFGY